MFLFNIKRVFLLEILVVGLQAQKSPKSDSSPIDDSNCKKITEDNLFMEELILGKKWRSYYVWDFGKPQEERCYEVYFKPADRTIVDKVRNTTRAYFTDEPDWSKATLCMKQSPSHYRSLLIPDSSDNQGYYQEILYLSSHVPQDTHFKEGHIYHVALKLIGRYLVLYQCRSNIIFLMLAQGDNAYIDREEIKEIAESLQYGQGAPSCVRNFRHRMPKDNYVTESL